MRRNRRGIYEDNGNYKTILLMSGGILLIAIITFFVVYGIYKSKINSVELGEIDTGTSKINLNSSNLIDNSTVVSSSLGKNVNEVKNSIEENKVSNTINTVNNESSNKVSSNKSTDEDASSSDRTAASNQNTTSEENKVSEEKDEEVVEEKEPVFQSPIENGELLRGFASENLVYSETLQEWITHTAIDIKAPKTTVVKAAEAGVVENIKNDPRYGLTIIVSHSKNYKTVYSSLLSTEFVNVGDSVEKGHSLGSVGSTAAFEIADEPHLHFEIIKDGEKVDPTLYIN